MYRFAFIVLLFISCNRDMPVVSQAEGEKVQWGDESHVFIFYSLSCPICQKYSGRLTEYFINDGIESYVVIPGKDTAGLEHFSSYNGISRKRIIIDREKKLVAYCGAEVTPQALVFDEKKRKVYSGKITDRFGALGSHRDTSARNYLGEIIDLLNKGEHPDYTENIPVGCDIE